MPQRFIGPETAQDCSLELAADGTMLLNGPLTFESITRLFADAAELGPGRPARIDLSGVTTADSAGLALLLEWQAGSRDAGDTIEMTGAPPGLLKLAKLNGAIELLNLSGPAS